MIGKDKMKFIWDEGDFEITKDPPEDTFDEISEVIAEIEDEQDAENGN